MPRLLKYAALSALPLAAAMVGLAWLTPRAFEADLATPVAHRDAPWAGSTTCRSCHPDHHASLQRTFHRTMTQQAGRHSVVGAFDGQPVTYQGITVRPLQQGEDYYFEIENPNGGSSRLLIERTVGLRLYQQYLARLPEGGADPTLVNPARLDPQSSADICGQCHGQRLFTPQAKLVEALHQGPSYRAGERLAAHVEPLRLDSQIPHGVDPNLYRRRFWNDGTPRLTAFEYQELTQSACFKGGGLTCISCHSMHGGDIRGQIEPAMRGATSCHLDRSRQWAVEHTARLWGGVQPALELRDGIAATAVESITALHTGDPVERAVAARLAGRQDSPLGASNRAFLIPHLLLALTDEYPAVRRFAHKSLRTLTLELSQNGFDPDWNRQLADFDFMAAEKQRNRQLGELASAWAKLDHTRLPPPPTGSALQADHSFRNELIRDWRALGRQRSERIHIGE